MRHAERDHAILSPSSAKRWINCTPSALLAEAAGSKSSVYAEEGTLAHEIAEHALTQYLEGVYDPIVDEELPVNDEHLKNPLFNTDMANYIREYCDFVIGEDYEMQKADGLSEMFLERKVDITDYAPDSFGSVDVTLVSDKTIHIIDLKYGAGVKVFADHNEQMMLYALGALKAAASQNIANIRMTIAQVRLDHYDTFEMSKSDLLDWAEKVLKPAAKAAIQGKGKQVIGSWCGFCPVKAQCRAQRDAILADFDEKPEPLLLSDEEIVDLIAKIDTYKSWIESVNKYVYDRAIQGYKWEGYKLVAGRSSRVIKDEAKIRQALLNEFLEDEVLNIKLKGIGDLEKLVGKKVFSARFGDAIESRPGAPKLVPESAKGVEYSPLCDFDVEG
uniref:DUF2800 domain-containing protein n=1 Tax=Siphoviridae sp. cttOT32 TaxID=2826493 RepID=A0A8S5QNK6_9CAUD|nr:MAG TPA: Protein of unknown function (DUF2800) [Siphoviridae sp. cttOT32]